MKRDNKKEVMNALIMVFQFGINMIVPIFLCTLAGVWIGKKDRSGLGNCSIVFHWSVCGGKQYIPYGSKIPEARG